VDAQAMFLSVLDNQPGPPRDIVLLNAGAAIYVAGKAKSLEHGIKKASDALASGAAKDKLRALIEFSTK